MSLPAQRNLKITKLGIILLWTFILLGNIPQFFLYGQHEYMMNNENRTVCILNYATTMMDENVSDLVKDMTALKIKIYYLTFFMLAYFLPFVSILVIYGLIIRKLIQTTGQQINKNRKRVTRMVIAVVALFVMCWSPLHIMLFLQHVLSIEFDERHAMLLVISNCLAYSNMCFNPIIYGFANKNFRQYIIKFLF